LGKYAIILNPQAGRGKGRKFQDILSVKARKSLGSVEIFQTEYSGHAKKIANHIKNDYSVIIAAGGDGTIHEIVNGMMHGSAALAAIPIGSGNDFVKMLDLPGELEKAIEVIKQNNRKKIDVGRVGDLYFPNGLGIGFDAWVVKESLKIKRLRGFLIYLYAVMKTVFSYENETITFQANDKTENKEIFLIAIGNGKAMGGGFFLTPNAEIDDGEFDVCIIHALKKREVFMNLPKAISGAHINLPQVQMLRTDQLKIESDNGIAVHADGELVGLNEKKLDVTILPSSLEVVYNQT
jgi:YegS/Rv2252/BmrU family lipid kinase